MKSDLTTYVEKAKNNELTDTDVESILSMVEDVQLFRKKLQTIRHLLIDHTMANISKASFKEGLDAIDKITNILQLIEGKATSRTEISLGLSESQKDAIVKRRVKRLKSIGQILPEDPDDDETRED